MTGTLFGGHAAVPKEGFAMEDVVLTSGVRTAIGTFKRFARQHSRQRTRLHRHRRGRQPRRRRAGRGRPDHHGHRRPGGRGRLPLACLGHQGRHPGRDARLQYQPPLRQRPRGHQHGRPLHRDGRCRRGCRRRRRKHDAPALLPAQGALGLPPRSRRDRGRHRQAPERPLRGHPHGHHRGEARRGVRDLPHGPGRVRFREPAARHQRHRAGLLQGPDRPHHGARAPRGAHLRHGRVPPARARPTSSPSCARPSRRTAWSRPATPVASTTAPPRWS